MGREIKPPIVYMEMPVNSKEIFINIAQSSIIKVTRRPTGAVAVEIAEPGRAFELSKTMRPFKTLSLSVKEDKRRNPAKKRKRIIRFGRTPLSPEQQSVVAIDKMVMPDAHCSHVDVKWVNDVETNTRQLICADCSKVLKIKNNSCYHTRYHVVKQYYSPHSQMRCDCCHYTWWDTDVPNRYYNDLDGRQEMEDTGMELEHIEDPDRVDDKVYNFGPYDDIDYDEPDPDGEDESTGREFDDNSDL